MSAPRNVQPSFGPRRRFFGVTHAVVGVLAMLALVVMVNYLAGRHPGRWFAGMHRELILSPQTRGLLRSLTNEVTVTVFYDRKDPFFNTVEALLREYRLANAHLDVKVVDYVRQGGVAQQVFARYQLAGATNKNLIIFQCATNVMRVDGNALTQYAVERVGGGQEAEFQRRPVAFYGEQAFNVALLAVTNPRPLRACLLTGHEEHHPDSAHETQGYLKFARLLRQYSILVTPLSLAGTNGIPSDCHLLVVAGPLRPIPPAELEKIEQYLNQGGRLLALFNSYSSPRQSGLEAVVAKWGVEVSTQAVEDRANTITGHDVKASRFGKHPLVQPLVEGAVPAALHLWQPRAVGRRAASPDGADAPSVEEIVRSGDAGMLAGLPGMRPASLPLAVAVEKGAVRGVVTERGTTRMVVVGDSFFLGNQLIESASNAEFAAHAVNWLLDRSQLLHNLGPRPISEFRLTLSTSQMRIVRWLLLAGLPGAVLLLGGLVWLRRRN